MLLGPAEERIRAPVPEEHSPSALLATNGPKARISPGAETLAPVPGHHVHAAEHAGARPSPRTPLKRPAARVSRMLGGTPNRRGAGLASRPAQ
ncbi:MAG: hypothetical protein HYZ53_20970 [Planctomycetes bacterium]|nr:hypothetical protein [Planctomycetota bacterium]